MPEYAALIEATKDAFNPAIELVQSNVLKSYLDRDAFIFSGLKTHTQLAQARSLLKDDKGNIRPYYQFEQEITKLNNTYNKLYLEAEYEFAVQSAQSADQWSNLNNDTNRYWLQYRTAQDERVRESHQILNGITLPKDDPFWDKYYPPNGWRCRCVAVEVLARNNTLSDSTEAQKKGEQATTAIGKNGKNKLEMFRFNSGKQQKLFPPKNSYMPKGCSSNLSISDPVFLALDDEACRAKKLIEEKAAARYVPYQSNVIKTYKNGGSIISSNLIKTNTDDYKKVYTCCRHFAKQGKETEILPRISVPFKDKNYEILFKSLEETPYYGKCPDFRVGNVFYEFESFKGSKRALSNMLNRGLKQSSRIIIDDDGSTNNHILKIVKNRLNVGQIIDEIWILKKTNQIELVYKNENPTF